jgi:type IV pilus assembly protein PilB
MWRIVEYLNRLLSARSAAPSETYAPLSVCPVVEEPDAPVNPQQDSRSVEEIISDIYKPAQISIGDYLDVIPFLIESASQIGASDIHIEPGIDRGRIRYRSDGSLRPFYCYDMAEHNMLINRIKVMAQLDIAEKRLPQDGRIEWEEQDLRVSSIPVMYGEKVVMRLLRRDSGKLDLMTLGMSREQLRLFRQSIARPHGLILISGPTGSGKTTTLYAALQVLNREAVNIVTAEDPIEYFIPGISQLQVKSTIGLSFANSLRSFLRQDPDIIMIGEIRDPDTVAIAVRASLTGHLVLSTVHTNSAAGAITRLKDMGIAPYLIRDTLICSVAQRLIRLLCPECKRAIGKADNDSGGLPVHYEAAGCKSCSNTGYKSRTAVFEIISSSEIFRRILDEDGDVVAQDGPMSDHGRRLVDSGLTSPSEFLRVFGTDVPFQINA